MEGLKGGFPCSLDEVGLLQTEMDVSGLGKQLSSQESLLCKPEFV